jgi:hypothetical protein
MAAEDSPTSKIAADVRRIADALEAVLGMSVPPVAPTQLPAPAPLDGGPAHEVWLAGQWKRRDGHGLYDTSTTRHTSLGDPRARLDPQLRIDVPAIDGESDLGIAPNPFNT